MKAGTSKIKDIFNGKRILRIPFFQRSYVWDKDNWDRFLDDMLEASELGTSHFFFGNLILKDAKQQDMQNTYVDLIDGQQRLTTLIIFLKFLCLADKEKPEWQDAFDNSFSIKDSNRSAFAHNRIDKSAFERILRIEKYEGKILNKNPRSKAPLSPLIEFYNYLVDNLDHNKDKYSDQEYDLLEIINALSFVAVRLEDHDNEQKLFDTINSQGVRLTTAELLKNLLFTSNEINLYDENWYEIFEKDEETKQFWLEIPGKLKSENIDLSLNSYLKIKLNDKDLKVPIRDRNKFSRHDNTFKGYKWLLDKRKITRRELITEIKEFAVIYQDNIIPNIMNTTVPKEDGVERMNAVMLGLERAVLIPYFLYILRNCTPEERNKIFSYVEAYILRRIICKSNERNQNQFLSNDWISNKLDTHEKLINHVNDKLDGVNAIPSNEEVQAAFHKEAFAQNQAAGVLYLLETKIRNNIKASTRLLPMRSYKAINLMPKKWEDNWGQLENQDDIDQRNNIIKTLGNMTIIKHSLHSSINNASWHIKKRGQGENKGLRDYGGGLEILKDTLKKDEWNERTIKERAEYLSDIAIEIWKNQ